MSPFFNESIKPYLKKKYYYQIDRWLQSKYRTDQIPVFERTQETHQALLELMQLNEAQDTQARQTLHSLRHLSSSYKSEGKTSQESVPLLRKHTLR